MANYRTFGMVLLFCIVSANLANAQPNILLIVADDLGAESLQSYAADFQTPPFGIRPATPNLNMLATTPGRSVRFTNCWTTASCTSSRATILTGKHMLRTDVVFAGQAFNHEHFSIGQAFQELGYRTAGFGKWHLYPREAGMAGNPIQMGFDLFDGPQAQCCFSGNETFFNWQRRIESASSLDFRPERRYSSNVVVEATANWINDQGDHPWFAYVPFINVHAPWHVPPSNLHNVGNPSNNRFKYTAMIQALDASIGSLLDQIDLSNTIVMFVGDNGNAQGVSLFWRERGKRSSYQGGIHVPCFVYRNTTVPGATTHDALIHTTDIFNTLIELSGNDPEQFSVYDAATDSRSFASYVNAPDTPTLPDHKYNYTQLHSLQNPASLQHAIRNERYKLLQPGGDVQEELYDLRGDPLELNNLMPNLNRELETVVADLVEKRQTIWEQPDECIYGETGLIALNHEWKTVRLKRTYRDPVVIMGVASSNGIDPLTVRVRNVAPEEFEVRIQEWNYLNGNHTLESVGYLVVEAGTHTLDDDSVFEAGNAIVDDGWQTVATEFEFPTTPVVLAQVASIEEVTPVTNRIRNVSRTSFQIRLQEEQAENQPHTEETVGWVAFPRGMRDYDDVAFESVRTGLQVSSENYVAPFQAPFESAPVLFASMQTFKGSDTASVRARSTGAESATFFIEEEQSANEEVGHTNEIVGYLAIRAGLIY